MHIVMEQSQGFLNNNKNIHLHDGRDSKGDQFTQHALLGIEIVQIINLVKV